MIASLRGLVCEKLSNSYILDVAGVGYEIFPTSEDFFKIETGHEIVIYIAESIKEDSYTLFGFTELAQRSMYFQLTSVSGVGPKAGMAILSKHPVSEIESAILQGNITLFSDVSGIGKKTAQRIILDLRGKLVATPDKIELSHDPAYQALISLGYSAVQARAAVKDLPQDITLDAKVKLALKELGR